MLSEYLDGRIAGAPLHRLERQLSQCPVCASELESLQSTVAMLHQLPELAPRRSFTMSAPSSEPARILAPRPLRLPQWAYAGAASLAAIALAVLVSTDATGLLAPSSDGVASQAETLENGLAVTQAESAAEQTADQSQPAAASAAAPPLTAELRSSSPEPSADKADAESGEPPSLAAAAPVPENAAASPQGKDVPRAAPGILVAADTQAPGTAMYWRVLEGLAAALGLVFVAILLIQRSISRRP